MIKSGQKILFFITIQMLHPCAHIHIGNHIIAISRITETLNIIICLGDCLLLEKNIKLFLQPRFFEAKFNADSKSGKKKWVSRACFRDNQHLMEAHAGVFEVRMAPPEVIGTKINTHKIIGLCRLNKCTNNGK